MAFDAKSFRLPALALLLAALVLAAPSAAAGSRAGGFAPEWNWPADPVPQVLKTFDPPPESWLSGHRGVDLAAPGGGEVLAPEAGRVSFVGTVVDRPVITIDHGSGLRSSFEPVRSTLAKGDLVDAGDAIGTVAGARHCSPGCFHWGVRLGEDYINPLQFVVDLRPSVLLPRPAEIAP
ncbi:peptidase M23 [Arthrobacter crystallopoietes BAB-32]|uniref:Peptidase M23 n=1 Tax=Arthrobacter crystallopoietes BAB-32 TaxID=1246476 RepID=N1UU10_9MICC|nr:M23 family metallopeptidase [Arthrobacter crystallopoietes]EMY32555.1 peptidase M23 [Arthrobacter crystallopoietes BAB-32]